MPRIIQKERTLAYRFPELVKEWNDEKNGELKPEDVTFGIKRKVWWICNEGHEWESKINNRSSGKGSPYCSRNRTCIDNCLATANPSLVKEWHPIKNKNLTPFEVTSRSNKKVWWQCKHGYEWKSTIANRTRRGTLGHSICPQCRAERKAQKPSNQPQL